ncbi:MAG TPA: class I SAM-dependent methyltransferase [Bryobacteraceae bacterium]
MQPFSEDPAGRFTARVENYVRYRPGYPREIVGVLRRDCGLTPDAVVADIGCGPGNLTVVFLENGNTVFGVEPNAAMRAAGERELQRFPKFHAVDGRAEATRLPAAGMDFVVAGQAFHWFEPAAARAEFRRILKPGGWVVLAWNERGERTPFHEDYEAILLRHGIDYLGIRESRGDEKSVASFFEGGLLRSAKFAHEQRFDFEGLRGRLLSSSYAPLPENPHFEPMLAELREVFDRHHSGGRVLFHYETTMWYGRFPA